MTEPRRLIVDHAGWELFFEPQIPTEEAIRWTVDRCPPAVTTYMVCPNWAGKFYYPCGAGEVIPRERAPYLVDALARGEDPFGHFLDLLRETGREVFITYRMNDLHDTCGYEGGTAQFKLDHPEFVVNPSCQPESGEGAPEALDYARPEVREHILSSLADLVGKYDLDGIQLDWMRFTRHLSGATYEERWEKRAALTEFTAAVRAMLDAAGERRGKRILLAARVPTTPEACRMLGCDVAEWTRQGLLDFLTLAPYLSVDFEIPFDRFHALLGEHQTPLYAGCDYIMGQRYQIPESFAAWALSMCDQGAEGLNLFNVGCFAYALATVPWEWVADLADPEALRARPQLYPMIVDHFMRVHLDQLPVPPTRVPAGGELRLNVRLPRAAVPVARALLLVVADAELEVAVNGVRLGLPQPKAPPNLFLTPPFEDHPELPQGEGRLYYVAGELLRAGDNEVALTNRGGGEGTVKRADLGLWP